MFFEILINRLLSLRVLSRRLESTTQYFLNVCCRLLEARVGLERSGRPVDSPECPERGRALHSKFQV